MADPYDDIPPLTPEYHRARRNLLAVSALLLFWEMVGIRISNELAVPGLSVPVTIANPEAIPYLLGALVMFFALRTAIEWNQCSLARRQTSAATADICMAFFLAYFAIIFLVIKSKGGSSLLVPAPTVFSWAFSAVGIGLFAIFLIRYQRRWFVYRSKMVRWIFLAGLLCLVVGGFVVGDSTMKVLGL